MINKYFILKIKDKSYDLIYVNSGEFIGQKLISILKKCTKKIVIYCADNPFVARDKKRWHLLMAALKYYDLVVFQHFSRIKQAKKNNLKNIMFVYPSYTQKVHCPPKIGLKEKKKLAKDNVKDYPVMYDALKKSEEIYKKKFDLVILLRPTSPFRENNLIEKSLKLLITSKLTFKHPTVAPIRNTL